ncbi:hypothetical protein [Embleya sp. MST-111070]|uniref:hypothetical protein n=1 Tax=Embleya sp. MST-111070 TaxID=3398231 RepID=UPI003F73F4BF
MIRRMVTGFVDTITGRARRRQKAAGPGADDLLRVGDDSVGGPHAAYRRGEGGSAWMRGGGGGL